MDRTKFANALIERRNAGEPFIPTANGLAPRLFAEKHTDLQKLSPDKRKQRVVSIYGEAHNNGCTAYLHQIGDPSTFAFPFTGVNVISPQTVIKVKSCINKAEKLRTSTNRIPLDIWAQSILTEAINHIPDFVDFPCDIALLQPGCEPITSRIEQNSVADPKFEVPISESELNFQQGTVQEFHQRTNLHA